MKSIRYILVLVALTVATYSASAQVAVSGHILNASGHPIPGAYAKFALVNCGDNIPTVPSVGTIYKTVTFNSDPITGAISGNIYTNTQIMCAGQATTRWTVTNYINGQPQVTANYYIQTGIPFNLDTATALGTIPPPPTWDNVYLRIDGFSIDGQATNAMVPLFDSIIGRYKPESVSTILNLHSPGPIGDVTSSTGAFTTLTSTGGSINGTIGATSPNTGAFTTVTAQSYNTVLEADQYCTTPGVLDQTCFINAYAVLPSTGGAIHARAGTYTFSSPVSLSLAAAASLMIFGDGPGLTKIVSGGNALAFTLATNATSFHVRDISILTSVLNGGNGLSATQSAVVPNPANTALSDITNVVIMGTDAYSTGLNYWTNGILLTKVSNVNMSVKVIGDVGGSIGRGIGLAIVGTSTSTAVAFNVYGSTFNSLDTGISFGTYSQGITITGSNFTGDNNGIVAPPGGSAVSEINVTNCQFDDGAYGVRFQSLVDGSSISNSMFIVFSNSVGISIEAATTFMTITGNVLQGVGNATMVQIHGVSGK